ncbi:MAG: TonB-dependent receptor [Bacteroidetes bacterium]|nr:TonB-dependent receptor [Bacteroidota bacterium]
MIFIILLIIPGSFSFLNAQSSLKDTIKINEVIVTGTKVAVSRNNVPLTVTVINEKEIEESSESSLLPVLSARVPGMFVTERGITGFGVSTGSAGQISIRGIGGSPNTQVLVLLNGNPQYMGIFGHPLPDAYVASDVERVEVIHGPASTLYGSNAMGGVINIITKKQQKDGYNANARIMYGSYNTQKYMVNGGYKKKKFNVFAGINHDQTDGHRDSSDFSITDGYFRTGYEINNHFKSSFDFSLSQFDATDPGPKEGNAGNSIDITRGMGAFVINNKFDNISGSLRLFYNFGEHNISDGFHSTDNNHGVVFYEAFNLFTGNTITLGLDYKNFGGKAENIFAMNGNGIVFSDTSIYELGGYILLQQRIFSKLMLNAGFRLTHNQVFGNEPVPSVGFAYNATAKTIIKGSVSKGFRSPTIRELFMWAPANNTLLPERMMQYETSVNQYLFKDKLSVEITAFKAEGDNLIKIIMEGNQPKYVNTGVFSNLGLEFAINFMPSENLKFHSNYSYISMDEPVIATPEQKFFLEGTFNWNNIRFNLSLQSIINLYIQTGQNPVKESYNLLNMRTNYKINKHFDVFVKGKNLLNTNYQINSGYPMPGIIAFGGINLHF